MQKSEIIEIVADKTNATKKETKIIVETFLETIIDTLSEGDSVILKNFGTFEVQSRDFNHLRNPKTGELLDAKKINCIKFTAGKTFKDSVR